MDARLCPSNLQESITAYVQGRPTGGFLRSVLENNLLGAVGQADSENSQYLSAIVAYVYDNVPATAWGSPGVVAKHLHECAKAREREREEARK